MHKIVPLIIKRNKKLVDKSYFQNKFYNFATRENVKKNYKMYTIENHAMDNLVTVTTRSLQYDHSIESRK